VRTRAGYTGGSTVNPTYYRLGDHTEAVQVDYDPERISYRELLVVFWRSHNPRSRPWSRQYKAAVFYHNEEQKKAAEQSRERVASAAGAGIVTEILPLERFYLAEDYHQKYYLRNNPILMREFAAVYPSPAGLTASTAAARVNGFFAGYGKLQTLLSEMGSYGLSPGAQDALRQKSSNLR
jgi:peptide-methionine (S)-S-oxide reductase